MMYLSLILWDTCWYDVLAFALSHQVWHRTFYVIVTFLLFGCTYQQQNKYLTSTVKCLFILIYVILGKFDVRFITVVYI